ncbi:MAG: MFS transporter [Alphaproteobacteria bacterium]|nr:MFS transporter [Alphaproteobacteria bacterium]
MAPSDGSQTLDAIVGPLERQYLEKPNFRNAADTTRVTATHWHIAVANGLGWMFDGMDGVIFGLIAPMVIREFGVSLPDWRTGVQLSLLIGITGMFAWPWLADRYGRRSLLAINIAMFSLLMPVLALTSTIVGFFAVRTFLNFALNGEWALGSMLVAETWPARLRGRVISINRGTWCFGASLAGLIATVVAARWGWRAACVVPAVIALLAIYVRARCPESPYWVRLQDRKRRIADARSVGRPLEPVDQAWMDKALGKVPLAQVFASDMWRNTAIATFIASSSTIIYGTVAGWMPIYLSQERHWTTAEYGSFYIWWGLIGALGLIASGWIADRIGRRAAFLVMLIQGAVFLTLWVFAKSNLALWVFGLLWSIGYLGFWGPSMTLTAEVFPTRIRGVANGFVWSVAWLVGFVLWPFVTVYLQQSSGSFQSAFLVCPVIMVMMAIGVWLFCPDHARKELDAIAT